MIWIDHDGNPYYMSQAQRDQKNDKSDGQTREVNLNMVSVHYAPYVPE